MESMVKRGIKPWQVLMPFLVLLLVLAVACGSAAAPEENAPAPVAAEVADVPTPMAQAAADPAEQPEVMSETPQGSVILMVSDFGTERFDTIYGSTFKELRKHFHSNLTSWDSFDGQMRITPGIATGWELSPGTKHLSLIHI